MTTFASKACTFALQLVLNVMNEMWFQTVLAGLKRRFTRNWVMASTLSFTERLDNMKGILKRKDSILHGLSGFACRDFANLYPSVPQTDLLSKAERAIKAAYLYSLERDSFVGMSVPRWGSPKRSAK